MGTGKRRLPVSDHLKRYSPQNTDQLWKPLKVPSSLRRRCSHEMQFCSPAEEMGRLRRKCIRMVQGRRKRGLMTQLFGQKNYLETAPGTSLNMSRQNPFRYFLVFLYQLVYILTARSGGIIFAADKDQYAILLYTYWHDSAFLLWLKEITLLYQ